MSLAVARKRFANSPIKLRLLDLIGAAPGIDGAGLAERIYGGCRNPPAHPEKTLHVLIWDLNRLMGYHLVVGHRWAGYKLEPRDDITTCPHCKGSGLIANPFAARRR